MNNSSLMNIISPIQDQSDTIDILRFPLAIAVVFIHSFGKQIEIETLHNIPFSGMVFFDYFRILVSNVLCHCAVPIFFLVSGYLFFFKVEKWNYRVYKSKLNKRLHSLVIPYILFNIFAVIQTICFIILGILFKGDSWTSILNYFQTNGWFHMLLDCNVWSTQRNDLLGNTLYCSGPILVPLWYLRDLICMVIITPLIYWAVKRFSYWLILFLAVSYISRIGIPISSTFKTSFLFFIAGSCFSIKQVNIVDVLKKYKYIAYICSGIFIPILTYLGANEGNTYAQLIYPFVVIFEVIAVISLSSIIARKNKNIMNISMFFSKYCFFVFVFHIFILGYCRSVVQFVFRSPIWICRLLEYTVTPLLCVTICVATYFILDKYFPRLCNILSGKRICS